MYLLFPGRHHLLTQFQFDYLQQVFHNGFQSVPPLTGSPALPAGKPTAIIFAVTSANHSNTRRNPLPFYLRAMQLAAFSKELGVPAYVYGIDDLGDVPDFADYTIKRIRHESDGQLDLSPNNTIVLCSTPVLTMYQTLGYGILPAELADTTNWSHHTKMPWDLVEYIAHHHNWENDPFIISNVHGSSRQLWQQYGLGEKIRLLFNDRMIGSDGDLTTTRDYNVYVRQMDEIAEMKFDDTVGFIQPGRIGDIGCAVGSWIKLAARETSLRESDFYGIEVSRFLFDICQQRKSNREFDNPFVFFAQKNAVTGLVFPRYSMNTIHTSSLTHEIESYGGRADLLHFIANRFEELVHGGVWINRDVVGPSNKDEKIWMWLNKSDGENADPLRAFDNRNDLANHLRQLSTHARFLRFARDFRAKEGYQLSYTIRELAGKEYVELTMRDATEFLSRKDYSDNWESEMHETFCFWDFHEWQEQLKKAGFTIHPGSRVFRNEWIAENRWKGHVSLFRYIQDNIEPIAYPVTTMILIAVRS